MQPNNTTSLRTRRTKYNSPEESFLARITPGKINECWIWPGAKMRTGYGALSHNHKLYTTHRISYEIYNGPIPDGLHVLHACDTPACWNPYHLRAGTPKDNASDRSLRGRLKINPLRGEHHANAKLTIAQVREIRRLAETGMNQTEIGLLYGVSQTTVTQIKCRRVWKHLE